MEQTKPFYDFCVPFNKDDKQMRAILNELVELGYKTIAIDQSFDHSKKDAGKRGSEMFPAPHSIEHLRKEFADKLKILQRITILYVDANLSHAMSVSYNLRKFNLIAGQPKTDGALTHCCTTFAGDIITFDPVAGSRLLVNRKAYQVAVRRGMFFEIKYAPAIADSNNRKDMIKLAQNYSIKGKSKNIIISSGAEHEFQLRGPYDVANLAFIFGLSEDQGKNAVDRFCRQIFLRAESRRLGKTIMFVKGNGPIVFSDSSDENQSEEEDDEMDGVVTEMSKDGEDEQETDIKPANKRLKVE
ncbi:ribonuclease P protein subunit p30 [Drosophila guanche]|uniref:Blast:Ribonuclease P protein subunit p30 n=1 Tax=Drosophila guanche TaxID=7266 RepID=A0A3B0K8M1_DROGU|nr:ribonuclease P protein subunit p30 [Drosophila guanche]SPP81976.1 blast:Ribonuclease P protein subunit p30 [Drosophila guanche]